MILSRETMSDLLIKLLLVSACVFTSGRFHATAMEKIRTYHNGKFTYIEVNTSDDTLTIYDRNNYSHHPILPESYFRGKFSISPIMDDCYALDGALPGKLCVENPEISVKEKESGCITVHFKLDRAKKKYHIMARSNSDDCVYQGLQCHSDSLSIELPVDKEGYEFSIRPEDYDQYITGIRPGFTHSIKYLNICVDDDNGRLFSSPAEIEIALPLFRDTVFDEWCVSGDIIQIYNYVYRDEIIWHGEIFTPCRNLIHDNEE